MTWTTGGGGSGGWHIGAAVLNPAEDMRQANFRLFDAGDELPHYDGGSQATLHCRETATQTAATSISVNKPTSGSTGPSPKNVAAGDLLLIIVGNDDNSATAQWDNVSLKPTGFTLINEAGDATQDCHIAAFYRVADGSEGSSFSVPAQSSDDLAAVCVLVSGQHVLAPINAVGADASDASPAPFSITELTTTLANCLGFAVAAYDGADDGGYTWGGTGWSELVEVRSGSTSNESSITAATKSIASAGASGAATVDPAVDDGMVGFQFAVGPTAVADGRSAVAAAGADATLDVDTDYGVSFRIENRGGHETVTQYKLQYRLNGGTWTDVTTSSDVVIAVATADYADGDDVAEFIGGTGAYVSNNNAACDNDAAFTLPAALSADQAFECHFTFQVVGADVSDEDTIQLRIVESDGTVLDAYTDTPTITVNAGAGEKTASGTPAAQSATAAGTAERVVTSSGAPAAQSATVAGTADIEGSHTSSGAPAAQSATVAGTAERELRETGSPVEIVAQSATVAGTAAVGDEITGSGAPAAQSATTAGTAERAITSAGAPAAQSATVAGTAERSVTGSGAPAAQSATVEGAGQVGSEIVASGTPAAQAATVAGTAERTLTGAGTPAAQSSTVAGVAERVVTSSGTPAAQSATTAGSGTVGDVIAGSGTPAAQAASVAGTAERAVTSSGAPAGQAATVAGSGDVTSELIASGAVAAQYATVTGVALRVITGSGTPTAQAAEVEGYDVLYPIKGRRGTGSVGGKRGQGQSGGKRAIGQN
jgi:hypothetical protein